MKINHNTGTWVDTSATLKRPDYGNYKPTVDEPEECIITNLSSPLGKEETVRYACFPVANVYKNTDIHSLNQQPVKTGVKVVCSVRQTWSVEAEAGDTNVLPVDLPVTAQLSLTLPLNAAIAESDISTIVSQVSALIYDSAGKSKIASLVRGSLKPSEV